MVEQLSTWLQELLMTRYWGQEVCIRCSKSGHLSHECKVPVLPPIPEAEQEEPVITVEDDDEPAYFMYGIGS